MRYDLEEQSNSFNNMRWMPCGERRDRMGYFNYNHDGSCWSRFLCGSGVVAGQVGSRLRVSLDSSKILGFIHRKATDFRGSLAVKRQILGVQKPPAGWCLGFIGVFGLVFPLSLFEPSRQQPTTNNQPSAAMEQKKSIDCWAGKPFWPTFLASSETRHFSTFGTFPNYILVIA